MELIQTNPKVRENTGRVALQRGPIVYCLEEADNGKNLSALSIEQDPEIKFTYAEKFLGGAVIIQASGFRTNEENWGEQLYRPFLQEDKPVNLTAVPYFMWGNRGQDEMQVWIRQK